MHVAHLSQLSY